MLNLILSYTKGQMIAIIVILVLVVLVAAYLLYLTLSSGKKKESQKELRKKYDELRKASKKEEVKKVVRKEPKKEEVKEEVKEEPEAVEDVQEEVKEEPEVVEETQETEVLETQDETKDEATSTFEEPADDEEAAENEVEHIVDNVAQTITTIRYIRSFEAKLRNADDTLRNYYNSLKNEILSYKFVNARMSFKHETFKVGRETYVKFMIKGKSLCVYFNLDPKDYIDSKYKIKDVSMKSSQADTPVMYKINNERRFKYSYDLIASAFDNTKAKKQENVEMKDYISEYSAEERDALIEKNLIKVQKVVTKL